jgi:dihydrofolate reductase
MKIKMITAYDKNKIIGNNNKLPWELPEDLQHFKKETLNKIIVMGKNTYLSLGKPLPNRMNAVISSTLKNTKKYKNLIIFKSIKDLLNFYKNEEEIVIIGGSSIYNQFLEYTNELELNYNLLTFDLLALLVLDISFDYLLALVF